MKSAAEEPAAVVAPKEEAPVETEQPQKEENPATPEKTEEE